MLYDAKGRPLVTLKERQEDLAKLECMAKRLEPKVTEINGVLVDAQLSADDSVQVLSIVLSHAVHQICKGDHLLVAKKMDEITRVILAMTNPDPEFRDFFDANYKGC